MTVLLFWKNPPPQFTEKVKTRGCQNRTNTMLFGRWNTLTGSGVAGLWNHPPGHLLRAALGKVWIPPPCPGIKLLTTAGKHLDVPSKRGSNKLMWPVDGVRGSSLCRHRILKLVQLSSFSPVSHDLSVPLQSLSGFFLGGKLHKSLSRVPPHVVRDNSDPVFLYFQAWNTSFKCYMSCYLN